MMRAQTIVAAALIATLAAGVFAPGGTEARTRRSGNGGGVPELDVKSSCNDAQKFSTGTDDKNSAYKGCMQDETNAKSDLAKRWTSFNVKDRQNCVQQSFPSPSYVEVLTCLELGSEVQRNAQRANGQSAPQIGGPVAPGLATPVGPGPAPIGAPAGSASPAH